MSSIAAVASAKSLFGVLGLPDEICSASDVKKAYRRLALEVHPDKCSHPDAKAAFQRLSEAYDSLNSETAQRRYLSFCSGNKEIKQQPRKNRRRWWEGTSFADFEKRWKQREEAEQSMRSSFVSSMSQKFGKRKLTGQMVAIEKITEQLDENASIPRNELWPPRMEENDEISSLPAESSRPTVMVDSYLPRSERPELDDLEYISQRFTDINDYLRDEHHYCFFCGSAHSSASDLQHLCPGLTEQCHEESTSGGAASVESSAASGVSTAVEMEVFEADPLDAFMAGVQTEVSEQEEKDKVRSANHKRKAVRARAKGVGKAQEKRARRRGGGT
jgi:hypothetical protein